RYKDMAILYRSVRTSSPPLVDEFRRRKIPFRCAGRTGLFLQPEAAVLGRTYAWLIDHDWKSERYAKPSPVTLDDLAQEFGRAFNDGKPVDDLGDYLEDWKACVADNSAPVNLVRD